ncbi:MAG: hypothetical protein DWQ04_19470 [Chloroflexi bacterium]|nr:MAG: hypothetical protein DWQ04_19470 [Chloroflexota bacterium]
MEDFDIFQDDDFSEDADVFGDEYSSSPDDDFDMDNLRRQSARSGSAFEDMDTTAVEDDNFDDFEVESDDSSGSGFSLRNFTPGQRLILAVLVLLDILAILFGVLVVTGLFSL